MFWRSLAIAGLAGMLSFSSCKISEPIVPAVAASSEFSLISDEKKQKLLEELVEEARAEGENIPIEGIYYYNEQNKEGFYEALEEKLGLSAEKIEWTRKGLATYNGRFYAITISGPKGSAIAVFDTLFKRAENLDDIRSNAIDHESQHARDFKEINQFESTLEKMEYELRALANQVVKAYTKGRKLSQNMGYEMFYKFQNFYFQIYFLAVKGYEHGRETLGWVNQQMEVYPGAEKVIEELNKGLEIAEKR